MTPHVWHPLKKQHFEQVTTFQSWQEGKQMRDVWEPTRFSLWNASCLLLTKETNRSKTEIQKELSLLRALAEFAKTLYKRSRLEAHLPSRRRAGLAQQLWLPGHSTCSCRRQDAARSWREIPGAGSPQDPLPSRRRPKRAGARDLLVRGVTAALAGGGFKRRSRRSAGGSAPPSPFWMSNWRTPIGWKWRISNLSQNVYFRRIWMREYYHIGWRAGESGWLSCKVKVKEVCLRLSKIWNFGSRFRDHSHE